jgi:hypothetical protein
MDDEVAVFFEEDVLDDFVEAFFERGDFVEDDFDFRSVRAVFFTIGDFCAKGVKS